MSRPDLRKLIRRAMRERGVVSVVALANESGVSRNTIYNWEGGVTAPALDELSKVARRLELPLSALVDAWDGRTQEEAAPDIPERLDQIEQYLDIIAGALPVSDADRAAIAVFRRGAAELRRAGRQSGAPRRKASRRPPDT